MTNSLNVRAGGFARKRLFLADPVEGHMVASLSARLLANEFCGGGGCSRFDDDGAGHGCSLHARAMAVGLGKLIAVGDVLPRLERAGVLFVRVMARGVLAPLA